MKKTITILSTAVLALSLVGCSTTNNDEDPIIGGDSATWGPELDEEDNVEIPSPITEVQSKEEAEQLADFTIATPIAMDGYTTSYYVYTLDEGNMIEVRFENDENAITVRKQNTVGNDISGDYNDYDEVNEMMINDNTVITKGSNGSINTSVWTDGSYDYSISSETGLSLDAITQLINQIG